MIIYMTENRCPRLMDSNDFFSRRLLRYCFLHCHSVVSLSRFGIDLVIDAGWGFSFLLQRHRLRSR